MHVLILNQTFHPDVAATAQLMWDLAQHLDRNGHRISVVTSRTFYGTRERHEKPFERIGNIEIHRLAQTNFGKGNMVGRMLDFASFYKSAHLALNDLTAPDVILALSSPPMVSALGMWQKLFRTTSSGKPVRLVYHVMDLYPDAAIESGVMRQNYPIATAMRRITGRTLDLSDAVIALGRDMKERIVREYGRHAHPERIEIIQPWADGDALKPLDKSNNPLAKELNLVDSFNVVYSGNLGVAHDLDTITSAIDETRDEKNFNWLFIGGGKRFDVLRETSNQAQWKHVRFLPFQDRDKLTQSLNLADVHLISQLPAFTGVVVPSKLFGIMAVGKPSVMIGPADAECSRILTECDGGFVVKNGDANDLVAKLNQLRYDPAAAASMGRRARAAFEDKYDRSVACADRTSAATGRRIVNPKLGRLQVGLDANAAAYRGALQTNAPGQCWDYLILTAANEKQAQGYRQELALRHRAVGTTGSFFPAIQRSIVVPDPPGRRAGSGGATFAALAQLCKQFNLKPSDLDRLHICLIHSGGASQRLPAYSPLGKIFAPLPLLRPDGQIATLFDHIYLTLAGMPDRLGPGTLILPGDALLLFDHRDVSRPLPGVTAISMRADAEIGRGHGVFVADRNGRVTLTLQKVSVETMRSNGATDANGKVLIDTGMIFLDGPRTEHFAKMAGCGSSRKGIQDRFPISIDLYDEMAAAMASTTQRNAFLRSLQPIALRRELWSDLHEIPFRVMQLEGEFLHLGTTLQFRDAMIGQNSSTAAELFQQNILAHSEWKLEGGRRVYHSALVANGRAPGRIGTGSVVEHSVIRAPSRIGRGSVVSQSIVLNNPIDLDDDRLLFQVPVKTRDGTILHVQVLCGVEDDFKGRFDQGKCVYLNRPIDEWMSRHNVRASDLWQNVPADRQTLWTARLFVATEDRDSAPTATRLASARQVSPSAVKQWRKSPRYSMAMLLEAADPVSLIEHRENVAAFLQTTEVINAIRRHEDRPLELMFSRYSTAAAYRTCEHLLEKFASTPTDDSTMAIDQARAFWCVAQVLQRPDHADPHDSRKRIDRYMTRAFDKIAQASEIGYRSIRISKSNSVKLSPGVEVIATSPVRLDLTGGWSDTPPYCFERGGHVINVAINLDGQPPISAVIRTTRDPKVVLESHDLGQRIELKASEIDRPVDLRDPFALHRIALQMTGLAKSHGKVGLYVTTECRVPKGSGLGTSSILAATLLAALHRVAGRKPTNAELFEQTLLLEQRLSTGGGWQDQIGGIIGGVKSSSTKPGVPQKLAVEKLAMSLAKLKEFEDRVVVYFSGQQRLARDILRRVMGRWLAREPAAVELLSELKRSAAALRAAMLKGQWTDAAAEIARFWRIKKDLYPGSTTPSIDLLLLELRDDYQAAGIAGAGGGGFVYFMCKDAKQAARLRKRLVEYSSHPGSMGAVYETELNTTGLVVRSRRVSS